MNMLGTFNCAYNDQGEEGVLAQMPSQPCWQGKHWNYVLVSVPILFVMYPLMIYFERKVSRKGSNRWEQRGGRA